jgi:hypothetical protein
MEGIEKIKILEPFFIRNLLLYPIEVENGKEINALSLEEALKNNFAKIEEVNGGKINEVIFKNLSDERVFAIDGEEIIGALQNRVINSAFLAERKSEYRLPVTCVEERRWQGDKKEFLPGEISFVSLRSIICKSVNNSLYKNKGYDSDQSFVWKKIRETIESLRVNSLTLSMHDTYKAYEDEIEKYIENVDFDNFNGFIAFAGKKFLCMDYFCSKNLFNKYKIKIVKGYSIDAIVKKNEITEIKRKEEVEKIIAEIKKGKIKRFKGIGIGNEIRIETNNFIGRALEYENEIVHLSIFEK